LGSYKCDFCGVVVEFDVDDWHEHYDFNSCLACYEKESDTGEIY
jgi:hypothetical protein